MNLNILSNAASSISFDDINNSDRVNSITTGKLTRLLVNKIYEISQSVDGDEVFSELHEFLGSPMGCHSLEWIGLYPIISAKRGVVVGFYFDD